MASFFFRKPDVWSMYDKRDVQGLVKALKYKDPEVREKAVSRLRFLAYLEVDSKVLSLGEIVKHDLVRAILPMLGDEDKRVREEAKGFYVDVLKRLGKADKRDVPDYLVRVAQETSTNDPFTVYKIRLECAVAAELAYEKVRRGYCAVCGIEWDQSTTEALFNPYSFVVGMVRKGTSQPAGRCPTCGNYYCAKCAKYAPGVVLDSFSVHCPKCNSNLTYHIEETSESDIRWRFNQSVSIRGINADHSFKLETKKDVEGLSEALKHKDDDIRRDAAEALRKIGDPKAVDPLTHALKDENGNVRQIAAYALGEIGDEKAVKPLTQALQDEDEFVRSAAVWALGDIGGAEAVEPLLQAMKDTVRSVRRQVAEALEKIKDARAVEPLIQTMKNKYEYEDVRCAAAEALGEIGDEKATEPLTQTLTDEDLNVQNAAKKAIEKIKAKKK